MPDVNPTVVIADCIEKSKATTDEELITDYITEALGVLQIDNTEEDAFYMLGSAIADAVADDEAHTAFYSMSGRNSKSSGSWGSAQARYSAISLKRLLGPAGCSRDAKSIVAFI